MAQHASAGIWVPVVVVVVVVVVAAVVRPASPEVVSTRVNDSVHRHMGGGPGSIR
jgi:hypothetical protein